jgi:hypothetical protein
VARIGKKELKVPVVQITFTLPDEENEYYLCNNATKLSSALNDFGEYLRKRLKYEDKMSKAARKTLEEVRDKFCEIKSDLGLNEYYL